jgi:hypothetical protein
MSLRTLTRKTKLELFSSNEADICKLLFNQKRTQKVCRLFLDQLKQNNGMTRHELSTFAMDLQRKKICMRSSFYTRVRATLLKLGLVAIELRSASPPKDPWQKHKFVEEKYVPVLQPIPKRPPAGINLPRYMWFICKAWNDEFMPKKRG